MKFSEKFSAGLLRTEQVWNPFIIRVALPHPSPLPLGEGAPLAACSMIEGGQKSENFLSTTAAKMFFPLPAGEGLRVRESVETFGARKIGLEFAGSFLPFAEQFLPGGWRETFSKKNSPQPKTSITKAFHGFFRRFAENFSVAQPLLKGNLQ